MRHLIPISGKDSCATALVQMARQPDLDYELFFNDVGAELPETYAWLDMVETKIGKPITRIGKSLENVIDEQGMLPSVNTRFCTKYSKIFPMEDYIGEDQATIYYGIRADEDREGYKAIRHNITPKYPLKELGIGLRVVYEILDKQCLRPPTFFWESVHHMVRQSLRKKSHRGFFRTPGEELVDALSREVMNALFAWRTRTNCYFCFFQRRYEWAGLLEYHPDLFHRAEEIENRIGKDQQDKAFHWIGRNYPLGRIRRNKDVIKKRRASQIVKMLLSGKVTEESDLLTVTSCGLFCGK